jgi:hypothetical protein
MRGALSGSGRARSWLLAAFAALPLACGDTEQKPAVEAAPVAPEPLAGLYEVSGVTIDKATGTERKVSGTLIVDVDGEAYTTTFDLATNIVIQGDTRRAELIGKGEGTVADRTLDGSAQTQRSSRLQAWMRASACSRAT